MVHKTIALGLRVVGVNHFGEVLSDSLDNVKTFFIKGVKYIYDQILKTCEMYKDFDLFLTMFRSVIFVQSFTL